MQLHKNTHQIMFKLFQESNPPLKRKSIVYDLTIKYNAETQCFIDKFFYNSHLYFKYGKTVLFKISKYINLVPKNLVVSIKEKYSLQMDLIHSIKL